MDWTVCIIIPPETRFQRILRQVAKSPNTENGERKLVVVAVLFAICPHFVASVAKLTWLICKILGICNVLPRK